ncbi:MAG: hypothetical protein H0W36_04710 [Gemmatimonadetes bacterium]|nr:hypothetical protein [Gemmatimonadota bacterium]
MFGTRWLLSIAMLLVSGLGVTAAAQETPAPAGSETMQLAQAGTDEANRAYLREFLSRDRIQQLAGIAGLDMDEAVAGVTALDGQRLANAAEQARVIDQRIAQDRITLSATTIIVILLLVVILIIAVG